MQLVWWTPKPWLWPMRFLSPNIWVNLCVPMKFYHYLAWHYQKKPWNPRRFPSQNFLCIWLQLMELWKKVSNNWDWDRNVCCTPPGLVVVLEKALAEQNVPKALWEMRCHPANGMPCLLIWQIKGYSSHGNWDFSRRMSPVTWSFWEETIIETYMMYKSCQWHLRDCCLYLQKSVVQNWWWPDGL